jgi:hypothetical protein
MGGKEKYQRGIGREKWIVRLEEWCVSLYAVNQSDHCTRLGGIKEARSARINLCGYFRQIFVIVIVRICFLKKIKRIKIKYELKF